MKRNRILELLQLLALVLMLVYLGFEDEEWLLVLSALLVAGSLVASFAAAAKERRKQQ